jgi:hypothetical protein
MWYRLFLTAILALFGGSALAQATLGIEPPVTLHEAVPGQTVTTNLKIGNPSPKPVRVRVSLGDWNYSQMGELQYFTTGKLSTSASAWTKVSDNIVEVPGKDVAIVRYTFTVPRDATPGSHWGMVFLTAESENPQPGVVNASMSVRVAHTFYVNVQPTKSSGKITGIFGKPSTPEGKSFQFAVQYVNTGNIAQILEGRIEVRDTKGEIVAAAPFKKQVVLPGATRILQSALNGPLPVGEYTALVILNYGDKNRDVAGEYTFRLKTALRE